MNLEHAVNGHICNLVRNCSWRYGVHVQGHRCRRGQHWSKIERANRGNFTIVPVDVWTIFWVAARQCGRMVDATLFVGCEDGSRQERTCGMTNEGSFFFFSFFNAPICRWWWNVVSDSYMGYGLAGYLCDQPLVNERLNGLWNTNHWYESICLRRVCRVAGRNDSDDQTCTKICRVNSNTCAFVHGHEQRERVVHGWQVGVFRHLQMMELIGMWLGTWNVWYDELLTLQRRSHLPCSRSTSKWNETMSGRNDLARQVDSCFHDVGF